MLKLVNVSGLYTRSCERNGSVRAEPSLVNYRKLTKVKEKKMYLKKVDLEFAVETDLNLDDIEVKGVSHNETVWPDVWECRVVVGSGLVYAALFHGDVKLTPFVEFKKEAH